MTKPVFYWQAALAILSILACLLGSNEVLIPLLCLSLLCSVIVNYFGVMLSAMVYDEIDGRASRVISFFLTLIFSGAGFRLAKWLYSESDSFNSISTLVVLAISSVQLMTYGLVFLARVFHRKVKGPLVP